MKTSMEKIMSSEDKCRDDVSLASSELIAMANLQDEVDDELGKPDPDLERARAILENVYNDGHTNTM